MTTLEKHTPAIEDVRSYWESNPLYSYEVAEPGTAASFDRFDQIKRGDVECYAIGYWDFPAFAGKAVLVVGCGPGWLTVQYVHAGARAFAIDLTQPASILEQLEVLPERVRVQVGDGFQLAQFIGEHAPAGRGGAGAFQARVVGMLLVAKNLATSAQHSATSVAPARSRSRSWRTALRR